MNRRDLLRSLLATGLAGGAWMAALPHAVRPRDVRAGLLAAALERWGDGPRLDPALRATNPEWDLMARLFTVLALVDSAIVEPERAPGHRAVVDRIVEDTLAAHQAHGDRHFLLPYVDHGRWRGDGRSLFVVGEIALMLGARRFLGGDRWTAAHRRYCDATRAVAASGPSGCGESYPNECWLFCNAAARLALVTAQALDGTPAGTERWAREALPALTDRETGMWISSFDADGRVGDGPEGSSLWMGATFLQPLVPQASAAQYALARHHLGAILLGFGWGREWPGAGRMDIDSGPEVPILRASAGSSGHAVVAARAFGDDAFHDALVASLGLAAFPARHGDGLRFGASNAVGDAVLLFGTTVGPLWAAIREAT